MRSRGDRSAMPAHDVEQAEISSKEPAFERLISAATALFWTKGVRAVGVDEIATAAGISKPTLYRKFASKDDLVAYCADRMAREEQRRLAEIAARHADRPLEHIRAIITLASDALADTQGFGWFASNLAVELREENHSAKAICLRQKAHLRQELLNAATAARLTAPGLLADGLLLLLEGGSSSWHTFQCGSPTSRISAVADRLITAHLPAPDAV
jgi:AcrR family transcriptional regulator